MNTQLLIATRNGLLVCTPGGDGWRVAPKGLALPWRNAMIERFAQAGDGLLAVLSNGEPYGASIKSTHWRRLLPQVESVLAVFQNPG